MNSPRTPPRKKARELAKYLRGERPDYAYLKQVFRDLRGELDIAVPRSPQALPRVPSEEELRRYYETVWRARRPGDIVLIRTLLYTGVRVSELVNLRLDDVDLDRCQLRVNAGKGGKDRLVPFPPSFKETLALHRAGLQAKGATYLFESSWKKKYSERGVRRMLERYARAAELPRSLSPQMTPSSSPTPAMPRGSRSRSTPASASEKPRRNTTNICPRCRSPVPVPTRAANCCSPRLPPP